MLVGSEVVWVFMWSNESAVGTMGVQETDMLIGQR
jgi:hypothetical protein